MDRYERIVRLHRLLKHNRTGVSLERLMTEIEASRATVYRDIAFLRDALGAPIETDADSHRFKYAPDGEQVFELPGLWLSPDEVYALLVARQALSAQSEGALAEALGDLGPRLKGLVGDRVDHLGRIRVLRQASRKLDDATFRTVTGAVLERRRLSFSYRARSTGEGSVRNTSPQRLTHYRDNWYLDAWDHDRRGLRSFALDRVSAARMLDASADDFPEAELDAHFASSYGIFSGPARAWATIRFSSHAARWVADERWHSQQKGRFLSDGRFELQLPFGNARELLMDVLRYGPDAEVLAPVSLREEMKQLLTLALTGYAAGR
jgi:predicted DNA-binding transcriptional regulator YafY